MILVSTIFHFSVLQIPDAITNENLIQPVGPRIHQLLATHYDCSAQYSLRQFSLIRVQKSTQAASENDYTRTFASILIRSLAKRNKASRCSAIIRKTDVFCAHGAHDKQYRHDRMD